VGGRRTNSHNWCRSLILVGVARHSAYSNNDRSLIVRLNVDLGPEASLGSIAGADVAISPDGTRIVYVSHLRLFTRRLDQAKATELAGTEEAYTPFLLT